jgi:hypothetical protein
MFPRCHDRAIERLLLGLQGQTLWVCLWLRLCFYACSSSSYAQALSTQANSSPQRDTKNTETKDAVEKLGRKVWIYTADLTAQDQVAALTPKILADNHQIRILVNCAGIQRRHPCEVFPDSDFNEVRTRSQGVCGGRVWNPGP